VKDSAAFRLVNPELDEAGGGDVVVFFTALVEGGGLGGVTETGNPPSNDIIYSEPQNKEN